MPDSTTSSTREARIEAFLRTAGWGDAKRGPLAGDASFRRYERLTEGERRAVLMDAPPPQEDVSPFVSLARHLGALGFSAPQIHAEDPAAGLLLIEDLGDQTFASLLNGGAVPEPLYALAVEVLVALHEMPSDSVIPPGLPPYDVSALLDEAFLLTDWFMPAALGDPTPKPVRAAYEEAWRSVLAPLEAQPRTLVLRDFFPDNLMWLEGREGIRRCGLLDFQDALAGPTAYDLVSLLEDARRDVDPALSKAMRERYLAAFPDLPRTPFETAFTVLGAQRHAKVIGIFTRLRVRDGKSNYLGHIPRVWRLFERALAHPALSPVAEWINAHIPPEKRTSPPCPTTPT